MINAKAAKLNSSALFSRVPEKPLRTTTGSREENKPDWYCSLLPTWYDCPLASVVRAAPPKKGAEGCLCAHCSLWVVSICFPFCCPSLF